jgi:hypothetical protein
LFRRLSRMTSTVCWASPKRERLMSHPIGYNDEDPEADELVPPPRHPL